MVDTPFDGDEGFQVKVRIMVGITRCNHACRHAFLRKIPIAAGNKVKQRAEAAASRRQS